MKLLFLTEARITQTPSKRFYGADQSFSFQMFQRYLKTFDKVLVVARTALANNNDCFEESTRVDGEGVSVLPLPYYLGPYQYLQRRGKLLRTLRQYIDLHSNAAVICRVPGAVGTAAARYLLSRVHPRP